MPLTKYQIRSEYSLADPDLYRNADRDDPEALLEGVAMAGLVGVLRQLGDLAEFAAEVFHDLHEEVMATASRGHGLMVRVQQLEAEFPSIEKAFLSQTDHSMFFCNAGVDWHPNMRIEQNVITRGDLPRCVMDSYEECRGPPRLFLLDKFDVAGAGACLKRYTDPSFFKIEAASSGIASLEIQREKKSRKVKKKGSRWRNGVTPEIAPTSHAKLHQLFLEERVENGYTDPACLVKLKRRQLSGLPLNTKSGKSYMEKFLQTPSPEHKTICERSITSQTLTLTSANSSESGFDIHEISTVSAVKMSSQGRESTTSSPVQEMIRKSSMEEFIGGVIDREIVKVPEPTADGETNEIPSDPYKKMTVEKELVIDGKRKTEDSLDGDLSEDLTSEVDNYMDALTTMESEMETDAEFRPKSEMGFLNVGQNGTDSDANEEQMQAVQFSDSQSIGNSSASDDGNNSFKRGRFSFSYSDTVSTSAENAPSDVEGTPNLFSSTAGMADASSNQLSNKEVIGYVSNEFESVSGRGIDKDGIPDIKEVPGSCVADSNPMHLPLGAGASSQLVSPVASELDEMPSDSIIKLDTDETGASLSDSAVVIVDAYSQTRDDIMFIASPESNPKDELDSVHPNVSSDVSVNPLKLSDPTSREKSCACSVGEAIQTDFADDKCSQHLVNVEFSCMQSVIPPMEEQFPYTARPEVDVHLGMSSPDDGFDVSTPDEIVCEVNDPIPAAEINSGTTSLSTEVEGPIRGTQVVPEADDGSPVAELNLENTTLRSTEIGSTIQATEEDSEFDDVIPAADDGTPLGTEVDHSIPAFEVSSDDKISVVDTSQICGLKDQQFLDMLHDVPEFESGAVEVGVPYSEQEANFEGMSRAADGGEARELLSKDDAVEGGAVPLKVPANYPGNLGLDNQVDLDDIATKAACEEHAAVSIAADAGNDVNTAVSPSVNLSSPSKDSMNFQESLSGTGNPQKEGLEPNEALSLKYDVESEAEKEVNGLEVLADLHIIPCESVCYDRSSQEVSDDIQDSSLADLTSHHIPLSNVTTAPTSVEGSNLESETQSPHQSHLLENSEDVMSSPSCYLRNPGVFPEQSLEAQVHQGKCLQADEESLNLSNVQPVQMQCPDHDSDQRYSHASSESCQPDFPSQPSSSRFLPQSLGKEVDSTNKAMNPLDPILPSSGLLPDANEVNLEEMPPLPPLPPMQWRMGKLLNVPPASLRDLVENSQASFSTVQPLAADNKAQFSSTASERGILQPGDPFLALKVREAESQNVPEQFLGNLIQPSPFQLQSPTMVCDADNQHNSVWLEGTQSVKSFLTLPAVSSERLEHVIPPPLEGDIVRSTSAPSSPVAAAEYTSHGNDLVSSQGKPTLTVDQATPRTGLEDGPFQHISQNSGEHDHPPDTSVPPQRKFEDKPQLVQPGSDGGTGQSLNSVTPPVSSSTEREIVWPSNAFALAPTFEVGKESSNPRVKLPRPRSPLVDAVAAHDRSTLRKVSERVRPQLTPKVEERDSLLEQIRTKSFNLKPAAVTRPSIQGPKTNLRVAAILEKANAIRQATAGSDEDDDTDSWSDS